MSRSSRPPLLARRWIWLVVAVVTIFLGGVAVGAGAKFTHAEESCGAAVSAIVVIAQVA
ncbi:hypothetical protein [Rhodococcus qingshengii]|uniref:hypothetical protein n=1 Tax=Rhodococcus qingshengii TaxID=334542 RepID=UPI001E4A0D9F|nr:hypothetical protein [Rhodococcus qingshengii]UDF21565.1 hypothetical protein LE551_01385 [Rhodococcus qingshengii]